MAHKPHRWFLASAVLLGIVGVACGGDDDSGPDLAGESSEAEQSEEAAGSGAEESETDAEESAGSDGDPEAAAAGTEDATPLSPVASPAGGGQALRDGFTVIDGAELVEIKDDPDSTYEGPTTKAWKATLTFSGDMAAIGEAHKAQIAAAGFTLFPDDVGQNTSGGETISYREYGGEKEEAHAGALAGKRTTDKVFVDLSQSSRGGLIKIRVEHFPYAN